MAADGASYGGHAERQNSPATAPVEPWRLYGNGQRLGFLLILFFVSTSNYFDYFVVSVLLEPIKQEFRLSDASLGLLSGFCFAVLYSLSSLPIARWADRGNRRNVITAAVAVWSALTACCGFAQSFWQLAIFRLGVGAVEPGAVPPAQSLLVDYFPPERRTLAIAMLTQGGSAAGWLFGVVLGGYLAARYGWRVAFFCAGLPGLLLAAVVYFLLPEPRCRTGFPGSESTSEPVFGALIHLLRKQSFTLILAGLSIYAIFGYGIAVFLPSFMMRSLSATLMDVSTTWGFAITGANLLGALLGGWLADRLREYDVRWYAWLPALVCFLSIPLYWFALASSDMHAFIIRDFIAETVLAIGLPAAFVGVHSVCGNARRAMAIAIVLFAFTLFGSGFGPLVAGILSDMLSSTYGTQSLRYSLYCMLSFLAPAAVALFFAARTMLKDAENIDG